MVVKMELSRIFIREMTDMQIIELTEVGGERTFPIVIGLNEAFAIERRLKGHEIPRPQTHELLASVIGQLRGELKEIVIHDLSDRTFFAKLVVIQDGVEIEIDSRPSDAIALGVAEGVPIYVAESVIAQTEADELLSLELNGEYEIGDEDFDVDNDDDDDDLEEDWG